MVETPKFDKMKKMLLSMVVLFGLVGCTLDDDMDNTTYTAKLVPVVSVEIPDTLIFRERYTFEITYNRPTSCYVFKGFQYERNGNERIIAVVTAVYDLTECEELTDENLMAELDFIAERDDFYIFRFWQGVDENGEPIFLTKEVPVVME